MNSKRCSEIIRDLFAAFMGLTVLCLSSSVHAGAEVQAQPNVVLIMADDLGYECIQANGGSTYKTPRINRLAEEGVRFEHCYSAPICTPSRVQIMTGMYNIFNYTHFANLDRGQTTFAHLLRDAGYATCIAGKWQLGHNRDAPQHFGFEQALLWQHTRPNFTNSTQTDTRYENPQLERNGVEEDYKDGAFGPDLIVDFIGEFIEANKEAPFLVYYPMMLPHSPFVPNPDSKDWDPQSVGEPKGSMDPAYFDDMIIYVDKMVGVICDQLEAAGVADNTYVIFTGDNGTLGNIISNLNGKKVRGGKGRMTNAGTHVPLIVRGPKAMEKLTSTALVDFSDFLPTLCEIGGVPIPEELKINGQSFLPQLQGEIEGARDHIYCWYQIPSFMQKHFEGLKIQSFARNERYKLYRTGELFDLSKDTNESHPLQEKELTEEDIHIKEDLQAVIDRYESIPTF
jgi:arylsulfatase A